MQLSRRDQKAEPGKFRSSSETKGVKDQNYFLSDSGDFLLTWYTEPGTLLKQLIVRFMWVESQMEFIHLFINNYLLITYYMPGESLYIVI